jgi:nickel/cobalt exporter
MTPRSIGRMTALCATLALAAVLVSHPALAQGAGPFGVGRPDGPGGPAAGGLFGWIAAQQSAFYRALAGSIRAARQDGSALVTLAGLSFAYGVFHAAGPGHGKAVISSYLVATGEGLRRGVALSCVAAFVQALSAIAIVGVLALALGATSVAIGVASFWLEAASYAAVTGLGLVLVWRKGRALLSLLRGGGGGHVHGPDCGCGHAHGVDPATVAGAFDLRRAAAAVLAIGLRPCTGALVVLAFAMAQGLLWAGVAATFAMAAGTAMTVAAIASLAVGAKTIALRLAAGRPGAGTVAIAAFEALAAVAVLGLGLALFGGLVATGSVAG